MFDYSAQLDTAHTVCWKVALSHSFTHLEPVFFLLSMNPLRSHDSTMIVFYCGHECIWDFTLLNHRRILTELWSYYVMRVLLHSFSHFSVFTDKCSSNEQVCNTNALSSYEQIWFIKIKFSSMTCQHIQEICCKLILEWLRKTCSWTWWQQAPRFHFAQWRAYQTLKDEVQHDWPKR